MIRHDKWLVSSAWKRHRRLVERIALVLVGFVLSKFLGSTSTSSSPPVLVKEEATTSALDLPTLPSNASYWSVTDEEAARATTQLGKIVESTGSWGEIDLKKCTLANYGSGFGMHKLCEDLIQAKRKDLSCAVLSYGIANDYSFDTAIQERSGCKVFCLDPTTTHSAVLGQHIYFMQWAAPGVGDEADWVSVSPPQLAQVVAPGQDIEVLKMDCEGCEYRIYEHVLGTVPSFFTRVRQFALEVHLSRFWMSKSVHAKAFGKLLGLLERSGFELMHAYITPCAPQHENSGCHPDFLKMGFPCQKGRMCQNYLFARRSST